MNIVFEWMTATWATVLEAAPWLVGGFLIAGAIYVLLPTRLVVKHLGTPGLSGVIKAAVIGVPLPLCSCSVIPVAASLRKQGASRGATASFLISTPESGVDSIALSYALLGPLLAVLRPVAAFVTAVIAGSLIDPIGQKEGGPDGGDHGGGCCCHDDPDPAPRAVNKVVVALRYGLVDLFADLAHWLALGFLLAGLVTILIPTHFLEESIGSGIGSMMLMVAAGLPLYVCATASTPFAAALIAKGLSPGAALVFLLVGPATNMATMVIVARDLGRKSLVVYVLCIAVVAVLFGLGTDAVISSRPGWVSTAECSCAGHSVLTWICATILVVLMINGVRIHLARRRRAAGTASASETACALEEQ